MAMKKHKEYLLNFYKRIEGMLPWSLRSNLMEKIEHLLREVYDHKVLDTKPYVTGQDAPYFELHMLIGKRHVGMCLWAIKSFLHFSGQRYHVVLHDDGTLRQEDISTLSEHLPNARVIRRVDADKEMADKLADYPLCKTFRFSVVETANHRGQKYNMFIMSLILLDINLLSDAEKIMVLDADVLFFKKPVELINWINDQNDNSSLFSVERFRPYRDKKNRLQFDLKPSETLNSGLLCYNPKTILDLPTLEKWVSENRDLMYTSPVFEQLAYSYLIRRQPSSRPLIGDIYAFNYTSQDVTASHFGMKRQFFENIPRIESLLH
jgi:hypothetical protein